MRKGLRLVTYLAAVSALFASCSPHGTSGRPLVPYVQRMLSDTSCAAFRTFSAFDPASAEGEIAVIGPLGRTALLAERLLEADYHDNIDGGAVPDGLPDFAGEGVTAILDAANGPYGALAADSLAAVMEEITVRTAVMALDTNCRANNYDMTQFVQKPRAKLLVLTSPFMSAYGLRDIDTLCRVAGKPLPVVSTARALIQAALEANPGAKRLCVLTDEGGAREAAVYEEILRHLGDAGAGLGVSVFQEDSTTAGSDFLLPLLDAYKASGAQGPIDALLVDDFARTPGEVSETLAAVMNPYSESLIGYNHLVSPDFAIVYASEATARQCYSRLRSAGSFTHKVAWPQASCYVTIREEAGDEPCILTPFSFHYITPEEAVFLMAETPDLIGAYVQN